MPSATRRGHLLREHFTTASPLKAQRLAARLSIDELATLAGCSPSTIARAERGRSIELATALALASALRVPIGWLWPDSDAAAAVKSACGGHGELEAT